MPLIIDVVTGARPNFMKAAALFAVANDFPSLQLRLIHTGQHYDLTMSDAFFKDLKLPKPACYLGVGSGTHGAQSANIMMGYEKWAVKNRPDMCIVVGVVNSTVACALVAAKLGITVAHVEAGLRSFDRTMPEEINRVVTDSISNLLFATEPLSLILNITVVVTNSGGMQEETTVLGILYLTLRNNTERPITVLEGTNTVIGRDWKLFRRLVMDIADGRYPWQISPIPYWDRQSGEVFSI